MAPIRIALIGLSSTAATSWASNAHLPYLLSPRGQQKYRIVALLNSSVAAAQAAIATYKLPADTKAYGDASALAADPDVDLVVCNTRVDKHYETVLPSVAAGKDLFVEWPLADNLGRVRELVALRKEKGGRTMLGLQGRAAPLSDKLRELIAGGKLGKIVSVEVRASGGLNDRVMVPPGLKYFTERAIGGNVVTIGFGHVFDLVQSVVGTVSDLTGRLHLQRPQVKVRDPATSKILETVTSNVPDLIITTGTLPESATVQRGAPLHFRFRRGQPFPGEPMLVWTISGEKGEIRIVCPDSTSPHMQDPDDAQIEFLDFETGSVTPVSWEWAPWEAALPKRARAIGDLYEAFAEGDESKYVTFDDALQRHEQIESLISSWESS